MQAFSRNDSDGKRLRFGYESDQLSVAEPLIHIVVLAGIRPSGSSSGVGSE